MAAEGGPAIDLRDDHTVRASLFYQLVDWNGEDLKKVYEPITDQIGYFYSVWLIVLALGITFGLYKKWSRKRKETPLPYKVIKPPSHLVEGTPESSKKKKRVVAVVGATGFVGSNVVNQLVETEELYVYMLGRNFSDEKMHPKADAIFQVDMMNYEALLNAFNGVDSVIHSAAAVPNAFLGEDEIWRVNVIGSENILAAAKECGVKSLVFVTGIQMAEEVENKSAKVFVNALTHIEQIVRDSDNRSGLRTCVVAFSQIYGMNFFYKKCLMGEINRFPLMDTHATFIPVSFAAEVIMKAEQKLIEGSDLVAGKVLSLTGCPSTFKKFFSLPQWGIKMKDMSLSTLKILGKLNVIVVSIFGYAPFGADLCPAVCTFFECVEEEYDNSIIQQALGIGEVPSVEDGVAELRKEFDEMQETKKGK